MLHQNCAFGQSATFGSELISRSHTFGWSAIAESESWRSKSGSVGLPQQLPPTLKSKVIQRVNCHVVYHVRRREFYHIEPRFWCFLWDTDDQLFYRIDRYSHLLHWPDDLVSVVGVRRHFEKSIRHQMIWFWQVDLFHMSESYWSKLFTQIGVTWLNLEQVRLTVRSTVGPDVVICRHLVDLRFDCSRLDRWGILYI